MAEAFMAYPELRFPFPEKPVNPDGGMTVLYGGRTYQVSESGSPDNLMVSPEDLARITGFELKPEGACLGDVCIPVNQHQGVVVQVDGRQWINLTAFADMLQQPWVADTDTHVWSFGEIPVKRDAMMAGAMAPDFEVTDREGKVIRMTDFKGMKALIVTWSSW